MPMSRYKKSFKRELTNMLYLISLFSVLAGMRTFTKYQRVFYGLSLGILIGFYNVWFLQRKISLFAETIIDSEAKRQGLGMISRFPAVILGAIIALKFDMYLNLIAYLIGFFLLYSVMMIDIYLSEKKLYH